VVEEYPKAKITCIRVISEPGSEPGRDILVGGGSVRDAAHTLEDVFLELTTEEKNLEVARLRLSKIHARRGRLNAYDTGMYLPFIAGSYRATLHHL